jgi:translation initiation factor 1
MVRSNKENPLVYSTEKGRINKSKQDERTVSSPGKTIKMRREVKGLGGKTVTTLTGFNLPQNQLQQLAAKLKRYCGSGGAVKEEYIILQGDQRYKIEDYLKEQGYSVKRAGG